jgi:hypothetical protein
MLRRALDFGGSRATHVKVELIPSRAVDLPRAWDRRPDGPELAVEMRGTASVNPRFEFLGLQQFPTIPAPYTTPGDLPWPGRTEPVVRSRMSDDDGAMPILEPHHDFGHPVEVDAAWSESYYFNGFDPGTDSGLFTRIGIRPNEGTMDVGLSLWLPGDGLAEYRAVKEQREMVETVLEVGDVRYEMLEPMRVWRLTFDGVAPVRVCTRGSVSGHEARIRLDLRFDSLTPAIGTDGQSSGSRSSGQSADAAGTTGKGHFEQAGNWTGWLEVDGRRLAWDGALGNRDKSWGPRHWGGPTMWRWFSINVDRDLHFGGIRLGTDHGDLHRGWVCDSGRATSIAEWRLQTELADDEISQKVVHLTVVDKQDREYPLTGEVLRVADIGHTTGTLINEGLTRWTYRDGDGASRTGTGIAEYLHQLDGGGRPVVPVD